jgi:membrane protein DedA with SNARE-associated domain
MWLSHLIATYGAILIAFMIALECVGIPIPGEAVLLAAAAYAGHTHGLGLWTVVAAASVGAFLGNLAGYFIGREFGYPLLVRYGAYVGLTESRIKIGQYLFLHHGSKVVVVSRFIALLRSFGGILAGVNRMPLQTFLIANAIGATLWSLILGYAAYYLGDHLGLLIGPLGFTIAILAVVIIAAGFILLARHERRLAEAAERAFPGPLAP